MCDPGNTAGFRPHPGRLDPWAFPGAQAFHPDKQHPSHSEGHYASPDEWLTNHKTDIVLAFFGYNESFYGQEGLANFSAELGAFITHTKNQMYNGISEPKLIMVSPIAFQDLSASRDLPDGKVINENLKLYTTAMQAVCHEKGVPFINIFGETLSWFKSGEVLTIDGSQLNDTGYQKLAIYLADKIFGNQKINTTIDKQKVADAVKEKNWMWHNDIKIPNGVHVYGRRFEPFGPDNYPAELEKIRQMTAIRDTAIWKAAANQPYDVAQADLRTKILPEVKTNYTSGKGKYLYGDEALATFKMVPGFKVELFASEKEFPDLANPVQISFDNKGRLWVATMPSYPHYKPGDSRPDDKLIILEDTDGDGKADKQTTFADKLHLPIGFEFAPEGVYVTQSPHLKLYTDTDGDDKADRVEVVLSGFDDHDTHHAISAFCADPSGAIYMGEGVFLHSNVETSYGPVNATNGGFFRYNPSRNHLERTAQLPIPNPWGIAFDEWGQNIFAETSGPDVRWMMPGSIKPVYGVDSPVSETLVEEKHKVRPTSGLEYVYSSHFPPEMQGDFLINNVIGFLGTKQHRLADDSSGYKSTFRQDLIQSSDPNFRPVDMEFAPDGSLYIADWHNMLIGHMQHNARDPLRDHVHGRIYRVTYPSRPLVKPARVYGATINELLDNLKLPEYRTRYRSKRELRGRNTDDVLSEMKKWVSALDKSDARYEHHLLEALWVSWGLKKVHQGLLKQLLSSADFRVRAAAVRVLRYTGHQVKDQVSLLQKSAGDDHGRVRLEAIVAASWLPQKDALSILNIAKLKPLDSWMKAPLERSYAYVTGTFKPKIEDAVSDNPNFTADQKLNYKKGKEIYEREGFCSTCHQKNGFGLQSSGFPPLSRSEWVNQSTERLIKITLKGVYGPMKVKGVNYPGQVPMTPYEGMLNDEEVAAVLSYIRHSFGNNKGFVSKEEVARVRADIIDKKGFYTSEELLISHPHEK
jgi:glucose/arabinose dehydrogenase/mono/diheme cytochrome c family protein